MNYPYRRPEDLYLPQMSSVTGDTRLRSKIPYEEYIQSMAENVLPGMAEQEWNRKKIEEQEKLEQESRQQATRDSRIALGLEGTKMGMEAYRTFPGVRSAVKSFGSGNVSNNVPIKSEAPTKFSLFNATKAGDKIGGTLNSIAGNQPITPIPSETGLKHFNPLTATRGLGSAAEVTEAGSTGQTAISTTPAALPLAQLGMGGLGAYGIGSKLGEMSRRKGGSDVQQVGAGVLGGAATGFVGSGFNPVGAIVGAIAGGIGSKNKSPCIIVTACTDPYSYEVNVARAYRDHYMDVFDLRGYYWIANHLTKHIDNCYIIKKNVKKYLVDKLVDYGEWRLGMKENKPKRISTIVTKVFLATCRFIGKLIPRVVRPNREVI